MKYIVVSKGEAIFKFGNAPWNFAVVSEVDNSRSMQRGSFSCFAVSFLPMMLQNITVSPLNFVVS